MLLPVAFAIGMAMPLKASATGDEFVFTYDYDGAEHNLFGVQRNVQIDVAMLLQEPALVGSEVLGISVDIPVKEGCACDPVASAWLTTILQVDGEFNHPDLQKVCGEIKNYGTESEPCLRLDLTFSEPYELTDKGVYVGYSLTVTNCNVPGSGWTAKYPVVTVCDIDKPQSFMIHCTKGSSTLPQKYPEWTDIGETLHQALAMRVIMRGKVPDMAASLEPVQKLYVAPATTGMVYADLNNYGTAAISSIEYSYTIESEGESSRTLTKRIEIDPPVKGQFGAYTTIDIPFEAPDASGEYSIEICLEKINGVRNGYSGTSVLNMEVVPFLPVHRPLIEDYTGLWCRYCPAVYVALRQMHDRYGDVFLPLTYHVDDAMQGVKVDDMPSSSYGMPKVYMENRSESIDYDNLEYLWQRKRRELAPADMDVKLYWNDENHTALRAEATVKFVYDDTDANYMIAYAMVEDGMSDPTWRQTNDYTNADFEGPYWDLFCGKEYRVSGLVFDDVVVNFPSASGIAGSLPSVISGGAEYKHSGILNLNEAVCQYSAGVNYGNSLIKDPDKLRIVALLIDGNTGNVCNAASSGYSGEATLFTGNSGAQSPSAGGDDAEILFREYFTLDGIPQSHASEKGITIVVTHMSDGTTRTEKIAGY